MMMMSMMCAFVQKKHTQAKAIRVDVNTHAHIRACFCAQNSSVKEKKKN